MNKKNKIQYESRSFFNKVLFSYKTNFFQKAIEKETTVYLMYCANKILY